METTDSVEASPALAEFQIPFDIPPSIRAGLLQLSRTEDVRFSPSNGRLALAGFTRNSVIIADVHIGHDGTRPTIAASGLTETISSELDRPHGLDFLDEDTIMVANRRGGMAVLRLADGDASTGPSRLIAVHPAPGSGFEELGKPGALYITPNASGVEVLVCNNASNTVTRHVVEDDWSSTVRVTSNEILLDRWVEIPDGIAVTSDGAWVAVSSHQSHVVVVYRRSSLTNPRSAPAAVLRGAVYPHGLRFAPDGRHLFVADAASPYVHVFACEGEGWGGVHQPALSVRVMDDDLFELGRNNPQEGGPKGLDVDRGGHVLVVTSELQPLAFFDVAAIIERASGNSRDQDLRLEQELRVLGETRDEVRAAAARVAALKMSRSFRVTAPLRRINAARRRRKR